LIRLAVRVARADAEAVLAELLELSPGGLEERELGEEAVEYVIYGAPGELPALPEVRAAAGDALVDVSTTEIADDWPERWKAFHRPIEVSRGARRLRVRPPWAPPLARDGTDIVIDPGRAFGTGAHETTRLCLEHLLELEPAGALADWGCGSGVLAIAAARLGWEPVLACDAEDAAVTATRANAMLNGVTGIAVERIDLRRAEGPWAPTVVANLVRPLLVEVAGVMRRPPERLIVSGLLRAEADEVAAAFAVHGLRETTRTHAGEWSAVRLDQPCQRPAARNSSAVPALASTTERARRQSLSRFGATARSTRTGRPSFPSQIRSSGNRIVNVCTERQRGRWSA
jgi:ribosomal protein L11 methyltransferase